MAEPHRVILLGFSAFERSAMGSYFRLATHRDPRYELVADLDEARFIVADADHAGVLPTVVARGRIADTVFVGAHSPAGAPSWMMRPIDPMHVMRELDALVVRDGAAGVTVSLPLSGAMPLGPASTTPPDAVPAHRRPRRRADDTALPAIVDVGTAMPVAAAAPAPPADVLMVDDSDIALRFLEKQLQGWQLRAERAGSSNRALELLARQPFDFVFLDVELGERSTLDGLALCQHIKRQHVHPGGRAPVVVLLSAHQDPVDRVRGTLAGCDAYLGKPLDLQALGDLLARHGVKAAAA
ncbi:MAG: response regulator [Aquabacterium sp.]